MRAKTTSENDPQPLLIFFHNLIPYDPSGLLEHYPHHELPDLKSTTTLYLSHAHNSKAVFRRGHD